MKNNTAQIDEWSNKFGIEYTNRNQRTVQEVDSKLKRNIGFTRTEINHDFLGKLDKSIRILEVGCNVGNQLLCLENIGFKNLYGIDVQNNALEKLRNRSKSINAIHGSALDIPFKDKYFDLVFTSGVLIHIHPDNINFALDEINRCSNKYVWGYEYYSPEYREIEYRGKSNLLWKADFATLYLNRFPELKLQKQELYKYLDSENIDSMFLLEKS